MNKCTCILYMYMTHTHTHAHAHTHSKLLEEGVESPKRPPGFQDFTAPIRTGKKKRQLPIAPRRRSGGEGEEEGEYMYM